MIDAYSGAVLAGLVGLLSGVVANILADDLPGRKLPRQPHCPHCGHHRRKLAWSGLGAFLFKRRQCQNCGKLLSWRHPILEVVLAGAFFFLWQRYGATADGFFIAIYVWVAALATVIDLEHKLILNVIMGPAILLALLEAALTARLPFLTALKGGAVGFGFVFGIYVFGEIFRQVAARMRSESVDIAFGYGDVTLATFGGLIVGGESGGVGLMLTLMIIMGGLVALIYMAYKAIRRNYSLFTAIPYGPNIVFGMLVVLIWRSEVGELIRGTIY